MHNASTWAELNRLTELADIASGFANITHDRRLRRHLEARAHQLRAAVFELDGPLSDDIAGAIVDELAAALTE